LPLEFTDSSHKLLTAHALRTEQENRLIPTLWQAVDEAPLAPRAVLGGQRGLRRACGTQTALTRQLFCQSSLLHAGREQCCSARNDHLPWTL